MGQQRRSFTPEFKQEAVDLCRRSGKSECQVARIEYIHNLADKEGNKIDPTSIGMSADFPQDLRNLIIFKVLDHGKTELTITEYSWPVGQMMEMSKMGLEQCLDKMAVALAKR
jgi:hypothetical protein